MGEKDISEKILADHNDVFADIINVCIFNGEQKIKENELTSSTVHSQYKADDTKLHELERDISKYWKKKRISIALYGLENQTVINKQMPCRILAYGGASYRSQLLAENKKVVPVISLVLYFGTKSRWKKPLSLKEIMDIPEELEPYVNDYKIHVINVAWLTDEQLSMFTSDFGIVANFFVQKRKNENYIPDDTRIIKHVDEVLKLLSVMTGDHRYETILKNVEKKEEVNRMCSVADNLTRIGLEQGLEKGIEKGIVQGIEKGIEKTKLDLISKKLKKNKTIEQIADEVEISIEEAEELIKRIQTESKEVC